MMKVLIFILSISFVSCQKWEKKQGVFTESQCRNVETRLGSGISSCKKECDKTPACNAINVRPDGKDCVLLACPVPIQEPNSDYGQYGGWWSYCYRPNYYRPNTNGGNGNNNGGSGNNNGGGGNSNGGGSGNNNGGGGNNNGGGGNNNAGGGSNNGGGGNNNGGNGNNNGGGGNNNGGGGNNNGGGGNNNGGGGNNNGGGGNNNGGGGNNNGGGGNNNGGNGNNNGGNHECKCTDTLVEDHLGRNIGRCLTKVARADRFWCYVASDSNCEDKARTLRDRDLYWSFDACLTYTDSAPIKG